MQVLSGVMSLEKPSQLSRRALEEALSSGRRQLRQRSLTSSMPGGPEPRGQQEDREEDRERRRGSFRDPLDTDPLEADPYEDIQGAATRAPPPVESVKNQRFSVPGQRRRRVASKAARANLAEQRIRRLEHHTPGAAWQYILPADLVVDQMKYSKVLGNTEKDRIRIASRQRLLVLWENWQRRERQLVRMRKQLHELPQASTERPRPEVEQRRTDERLRLLRKIRQYEVATHDWKLEYEDFHARHMAFSKYIPDTLPAQGQSAEE